MLDAWVVEVCAACASAVGVVVVVHQLGQRKAARASQLTGIFSVAKIMWSRIAIALRTTKLQLLIVHTLEKSKWH
jgi:hypothetical protein